MYEDLSARSFLEPGDVIFVAANHTFAKWTSAFQRKRQIANAHITHVAIAADINNIIEAQKTGATAVPIPFDEWRSRRITADRHESYRVMRHPSLGLAQNLIPVMDASVFVEKEKYALFESIRRTATPPGKSNCANLAARILERPGLAELTDLLAESQVLPGELLAELERQGFLDVAWETLESAGSDYIGDELINIHRRDQWQSWKLKRDMSSLDALADAARESTHAFDAANAATFFRRLRESTELEMFAWFLRAVDASIFKQKITLIEFNNGAPNWTVEPAFKEYIQREVDFYSSNNDLILKVLHLAHGAYREVCLRVAQEEDLFQDFLQSAEKGHVEPRPDSLRCLLRLYASCLYDFLTLAGQLPSREYLSGFSYAPNRAFVEIAPALEIDPREHPLARTLRLTADMARVCSRTLFEFDNFLSLLFPNGFPAAKSILLDSLCEDGLLPAVHSK